MNKDEFVNFVEELNINIDQKLIDKLDKYYEMIVEYNKHTNITSITALEDVYLKHFYDSLTLIKAIDLNITKTICDVGTGAGFPGIVLSLFFPNLMVTLVESNNKKIDFLKMVKAELNLTNVIIINDRVEIFCKNNREKYDLVTCRALAKLNIISEICLPLVKIKGYFIPMKAEVEEELLNLNFLKLLDSSLEKIIRFVLPIDNMKRTLLVIKKNKKINTQFPRNYNIIKKKPL